MSIRDEIRALCAEHDRFMAEQESEAIRRPPVSEPDDAGLVYKEFDNGAPAPAAEPDAAPFEGAAAPSEAGLWSDEFVKTLADILDDVEQRMRREWKHEIEREITVLRNENAELRGFLGGLLAAIGPRTEDVPKSGQIVDLPAWRRRDGT